ncbi:MAG TPA: hypothetical protein PKC77_14155 [Sphingopyxis sp.]|nr:hypothetical protein [Sphingopyxis sp.]
MKAQPVSIREPEIGALVAGAMSVLIRPVGRLAALAPGDLLWVREPFHLGKLVDHLKPTAALARGVRPFFAADRLGDVYSLGRRRNARELPKAWHRQHLRIDAIDRRPLRDVAACDAVLRAAGWRNRAAFVRRWDEDAAFNGARLGAHLVYAANPEVLRIAFTHVTTPLPGYDPAAPPRQLPRPATSRDLMIAGGVDPDAPFDCGPFPRKLRQRVPAGGIADPAPCPRCGTRRDRGCDHFPLTDEVRP